MLCQKCKRPLLQRVLPTHQYRECGLDDVVLLNIEAYCCDDCGVVMPLLGDAEELASLIAKELLKKKSSLTRDEAHFLKKWQKALYLFETAVTPLHIEIDVQNHQCKVLRTHC